MSYTLIKYTWPQLRKTFWLRPWYWIMRHPIWSLGVLGILIAYTFCLPDPLFKDPLSTVLEDRNGKLLGAHIAEDGQWRFPAMDSVPGKFAQAITTFEDKRFYYHPGVDPIAIIRAIWLNISNREIISGGSTLSMQVIRLARKGKARTVWEKVVEIIWATRLELRYSKAEILGFYASYAPFGGNVVGLDAAAWKYFGRPATELSWSEAATMAVLPNAPSLIHPGKNRDLLMAKRNQLLEKIHKRGLIDSVDMQLAMLEPLPARPRPLPQMSTHLLDEAIIEHKGGGLVRTTIQAPLQQQVNEIVARYHKGFRRNGIHNAAVIVAEVESGAVCAYVGNTPGIAVEHGHAVNIIPAPRSTGSIMKPFLYASMLTDGALLPKSLVPDVPSYFGAFHPQNFDEDYQGAVSAHRALARSLNVPAVHMLQRYGTAKFHEKLSRMGMRSLTKGPGHYGLTLVLGGAEGSLWDLTGMYASMARSLNQFSELDSRYASNAYHPLFVFCENTPEEEPSIVEYAPLGAAAIWQTFEALLAVSRPSHESEWQRFSSSSRIAWKTGTSYGFRDAWAIGLSPDYVVGVWVGNADGEGRPGLVGSLAAAPILFDVFDGLEEKQAWFYPPYDDMAQVLTCRQSGYLAGPHCPDRDTSWVPSQGERASLCKYHRAVSVDPQSGFRVSSDCMSPLDMEQTSFFVLPALEEVYYRNHHPDYIPLPAWRQDCEPAWEEENFSFIYPKPYARIFIPVDLDGKSSETVFEVAHKNPEAILYWHLDEAYIGQTTSIHQLSVQPSPGIHRITVVDETGRQIERQFEILAQSD